MSRKCERIVCWSETDGAFVVEVPELPGCMADGRTCVEAAENVQLVIEEWVATAMQPGRPIPEPKGRLPYA